MKKILLKKILLPLFVLFTFINFTIAEEYEIDYEDNNETEIVKPRNYYRSKKQKNITSQNSNPIRVTSKKNKIPGKDDYFEALYSLKTKSCNSQYSYDLFSQAEQEGFSLATIRIAEMYALSTTNNKQLHRFSQEKMRTACEVIFPLVKNKDTEAQFLYALHCDDNMRSELYADIMENSEENDESSHIQYIIGEMHRNQGEKDAAYDYFIKAAYLGHPIALCQLSEDTIKNDSELLHRLKRSVNRNYSCAQKMALKIIEKSTDKVISLSAQLFRRKMICYSSSFSNGEYLFVNNDPFGEVDTPKQLNEYSKNFKKNYNQKQREEANDIIIKYSNDIRRFINNYL